MAKSFYSWLLQFKSDNTPLGDLARDAKADKDFPRHAISYKHLNDYLVSKAACKDALSIFEKAFREYEKSYKNT